jgi:hypothetical protein
VVVDDVEEDLDAGPVQQLDHALELVEHALRVMDGRIRRVRGEEPQRVVAPVVRQAAPEHFGLGGERLHGKQLDGGDCRAG